MYLKRGKKVTEKDRFCMRDNEIFYNCTEICEILSISAPTAYRLIAELNEELQRKGYLTFRGRVSRKYFRERFYGLIPETSDNTK